MSYEKFIDKKFNPETESIIAKAEEIIQEYRDDGYTPTLRQLYYQFVARDIIPNSNQSYKRLGKIVTNARLAGLLPWDGIEDRGRAVKGWLVEEDMSEILKDLPYAFAADRWAEQDRYIEVWVEKEALANVVSRAVRPFRTSYIACKGYLSASEAYRAGKRMYRARMHGQTPLVIHLGDHDPSGLDMTRDNRDRLKLFNYGEVEVQRIALNYDQVEEYSPPPNPAKVTDSRAKSYIAEHGSTSWELDALDPPVLVELIKNAIEPHIDWDAWRRAEALEKEKRKILHRLRDNWGSVESMLLQLGDDNET